MGLKRQRRPDSEQSPAAVLREVVGHAMGLIAQVDPENQLKVFILRIIEQIRQSVAYRPRSLVNSVVYLHSKLPVIEKDYPDLASCVRYLYQVFVDQELSTLRESRQEPLLRLIRRIMSARNNILEP